MFKVYKAQCEHPFKLCYRNHFSYLLTYLLTMREIRRAYKSL